MQGGAQEVGMLAAQSPFPCQWWGTTFANIGLDDVRPRVVGSYGRYVFARLPPLPFEMRGVFAWLAAASLHEYSLGYDKAVANARAIDCLLESSDRRGVRLPEAFIKFMKTP